MRTAIKMRATVLPGNRLELQDAELPEGNEVEVIVLLPENGNVTSPKPSILDFLASLPKEPSPRSFDSWEEYEQFLHEERNSWDR